MLEEVRRAARSGFSYILIAALIVIFAVFFGVPADSCNPGQTTRFHVANIDGEAVHTDEVNLIYNRTFGSRDQQDDPEQLQRQQAQSLKAYLMIELLANKAREGGLRVDDDEFREYMQDPLRNPEYASVYGQDGSWDGALYERYVKHLLHSNVTRYQEFKRDEALARKYMNLLEMQVALLPQELESAAKLRNTEYELDFVEFDPEALSDELEVTDEDVEAFLEDNYDRVEEAYEQQRDEYTEPERMEVRRIYLERGKEDAQQRFEEAQQRLEDGEDFATVAGEINDALRDEQGLLEMTAVDNVNQDIVTALEDAEEGDVEEIETENELMLVRLEEREEAVETPIDEVEEEIARDLLREERAGKQLEELADTLLERAEDTGSLREALEELQDEAAEEEDEGDAIWSALEINSTGSFDLEGEDISSMLGGQISPGMGMGQPWDRIPEIGQSRKLAVAVHNDLSEDKPLSDRIFEVDGARVVVELTNLEKTDDEEPSEDLELVEELRQKKVSQLLGQWQMVFIQPSMEYGPWLERQFDHAVSTGTIELLGDNHPMAAIIDPEEKMDPSEAAEESPLQLEEPEQAPEGEDGKQKGGAPKQGAPAAPGQQQGGEKQKGGAPKQGAPAAPGQQQGGE